MSARESTRKSTRTRALDCRTRRTARGGPITGCRVVKSMDCERFGAIFGDGERSQ
jgi:hypothetical protein